MYINFTNSCCDEQAKARVEKIQIIYLNILCSIPVSDSVIKIIINKMLF